MSKDRHPKSPELSTEPTSAGLKRLDLLLSSSSLLAASLLPSAVLTASAQAQQAPPSGKRPNILVIMGDDIGWNNLGSYHQGLMLNATPNLDKLAAEGMRFTDYYAEASCTAGRANFITGELPIRTGMTTVGQAGSPLGMPAEAPTIAAALKSMGYTTGQFGKNHLGDRNEFLPTMHGFDEYFGYLYHLNAMEDPFWYTYPPEWKATVGPRNMVHSWATDVDDPTVEPRWGKVGKQKIVDEGPLPPHPIDGIKYNMTTFDEVISASTIAFMDKAKKDNKPFFVWMNPTRAHVNTHLSPKYDAIQNPETGFGMEEAALKQMDDNIGVVLTWLKDNGLEQDTIVVFTTDNGAELYTWPDGGTTPFAGGKGEVTEGSYRCPCLIRWPGRVKPGSVSNGIISGLDWFPTLVAAAGNPNIKEELLKGKEMGGRTYKVHLDGYDQTDMITGKGPSNRHEVWYFAQTKLGALRVDNYKFQFIEQPKGWVGNIIQPNMPKLTNLRHDPFERMNWPNNGFAEGSVAYWDSFKHEMWRFQISAQVIAQHIPSFVEYPPMQAGASFNVGDLKEKVEMAIKASQAHSQ
ncbi:arylsulfatase [Bradyrhizobium rifense]|uniref:Arylsulfatase n=1 Tax=Bradyrhizobium rifense TaxID=515499 RepID=A0A5D3KAN6_9BRAD|nr:arylsulfatase [Bradyrhizobium rifense]